MKLIYLTILLTSIACSTKKGTPVNSMSGNTDYQEQHRLQFHFSPKEKWMNDPNGMVFHNGEYHLLYQFDPHSSIAGPRHWGHAVSKDLMHWEHLPIALYPESLGEIYSGSAVVDLHNTSGFGVGSEPPLVSIFTFHDMAAERSGSDKYETQGIAYSIDNGRHWTMYEKNPVLSNPGIRDFRDPKIFWLESQSKWVMALAVTDHISFYSSPDLKNWKAESDFGKEKGAHGGVWECPDLFQLNEKWVLLVSINPGGPNGGSATQYFVGDFDGKTFVPQDYEIRWLDYGRDNYAGVTWSDIPEPDGRRIFIGWMSNWDYAQVVPTEVWRSAMTLPRELKLSKQGNRYLVKSKLIEEIYALHSQSQQFEESNAELVNLNVKGWPQYDLQLNLEAVDLESKSFEIQLSNVEGDILKIGYLPIEKLFYVNRDGAGKNDFSENFNGLQTAPFDIIGSKISLRLLVDVGSVELFVNDGELTMTSLFFPQQPLTQAHFINDAREPIVVDGIIYEMSSIWL